MSEYRNHIINEVLRNPAYSKHVSAMTKEDLYSKAEIAEELAWRDMQIAELKKDAARYRWLRDKCMDDPKTKIAVMDGFIGYEEPDYIYGNELDAAIDAAMEAQRHE